MRVKYTEVYRIMAKKNGVPAKAWFHGQSFHLRATTGTSGDITMLDRLKNSLAYQTASEEEKQALLRDFLNIEELEPKQRWAK